jgi:uncharacterized repeat protein (TIGR03803 family)
MSNKPTRVSDTIVRFVILGSFIAACVVTGAAQSPRSYSFAALFQFDGTNGTAPNALILGSDGNFYGTTLVGGTTGYGTVFKVTPSGIHTTLYNFCSLPNCADGGDVFSGVVEGRDGNFYGTTFGGGVNAACEYQGGCGTVYRVTPAGKLTTLYSFGAQGDGGFCYGGLTLGKDGNFYGTTAYAEPGNGGSVFKITPAGKLTTLYHFCTQAGCPDGHTPQSSLIEDGSGNFYGTTNGGGSSNNGGTIFKMTESGKLTTLHKFCSQRSCLDGAIPIGSLTFAGNGKFFGTTYSGGSTYQGTVYTITASGVFQTLHTFDFTNGANPYDALIKGEDGNFYGTTAFGGASDAGTIFTITPAGVVTVLHNFTSGEGSQPQASLILGEDGNFYGTATAGATDGDGAIFKLSLQ